MAEVRKSGHAEIDIDAGNDIEIEDSTLISKVGRYGRADIEITSRHGDIEIEIPSCWPKYAGPATL